MIHVDGKAYPKQKALKEFKEAMRYCEGSELERMTFAYFSILDGYKVIDTYKETAM